MYTALLNENGVTCLTVIVNERQLTMPYGGRNHKQHSLQACILKNHDEQCKMILYYSTFTVLIISQGGWYYQY
jgi:hypothetical protein